MATNDSERAKRLAEALRTNLHRRKAQSRQRDAEPVDDKAQRHGDEAREADA